MSLCIIAKSAHLFANNISMVCGTQFWSYDQLNSESKFIKEMLVENRICKGITVAICVPRSTEMFSLLIGIMLSGARYVPIDPGFPHKRIEDILKDACPTAVICNKESPILSCFAAEIYRQIEIPLSPYCISFLHPNSAIQPKSQENPAYTIYTSGTTGNPKGVTISHQALSNFINSDFRQVSTN